MGQEAPHTVLEYRISTLETAFLEMRTAVKSIDGSLQSLARLELRHAETRDGLARAFASLEKLENRLRTIETEMPTMKLIRNWVVGGVISGLSLGAIAGIKIVSDNQEYRIAAKAAVVHRNE